MSPKQVMVISESQFVEDNPHVCDAAIEQVLQILPTRVALSGDGDAQLVVDNQRVGDAMVAAELCLIEAMLPVIRSHVESRQVELATGDDYLLISANLVRQLMERWLVVDLTAN